MRRDYTVAQFLGLIADLRRARPGIALSTDIIAGFCGETDAEFEATLRLMEKVRFDFAFMFKYSAREGTVAHRSLPDDVPEKVKGERLRRVIDLQERISGERNAERVGGRTQILVEGPAKKTPASIFGRTPDFKGAVVPGAWPANTFLDIRVTGASPHTLFGVALEPTQPAG
jgi:tRNA-2-methylthio-N6-dimethylallyladenosine synthase